MKASVTLLITLLSALPALAQWQYGGIPLTDFWQTLDLSVQSDGEGGMLLAWSDYRSSSNGTTYVQRVDSSGQVLWQEYGVLACTSFGSHINPVAGDANGNGVTNGIDVVFITNYFKGGAHPPDSCMCVGETFLYHAADANGNCSFNGIDATYLYNYLKGSGSAPLFCPTCPMSRNLAGEEPAPSLPAKTEESTR